MAEFQLRMSNPDTAVALDGGSRDDPRAQSWRDYWQRPGGGKEVFTFSYPLMVSQMTFTVQTYINRLLLTWYSPAAVAAATSGIFLTQVAILPCVAVAEYSTTFVAQYLGANRPDRVGPAVWQGAWFVISCALGLAALAQIVPVLFKLAGHPPELLVEESSYSRILLLGALPTILMPALASFFAGRGDTRTVLYVNIAS